MRIISGKNKGKVLNGFKLETTRPTSDLVKQALFNIISFKIENSVFLDLFGGTGACGIEAISRGAKQVVFVDNNKESVNLINSNLKLINAKNYTVLSKNYDLALNQLKEEKVCFDIIFIDPPYKSDFAEKSINFIINNNLLNEDGLIVWEHDKDKLAMIDNAGCFKTKKYGIKYLSYCYKDNLKSINI